MQTFLYNKGGAFLKAERIKDITSIAAMTAIITVCSWVTIPYIVPFTLQTFAMFCAVQILGGKKGTISIALYILLGIIGVPVFSGFSGGVSHIIGPTGGYIVGFLFAGIIYMLFEPLIEKKFIFKIIALILGLLICYLIGTIWFSIVYANQGKEYDFIAVLSMCVFPYIIPDGVKMAVSLLISGRIKKAIDKI